MDAGCYNEKKTMQEGAAMYQFDRSAYEKRVDWFRKARFGMFIHWGLYSIPGRGEWVRSNE